MDERPEQEFPLGVFFSYASEDETLRQELEKHLIMLKHQKLITSWHKYDISAGMEKEQEIYHYLSNAQIILLLISPDFLASDFCYGTELTQALERHETQAARVIPIIIRPISWEGAPFRKLQVLPKDGVPITSARWFSRDEAWQNVVEELRIVISELTTATKPAVHTVPAPCIWHVPYRRNLFFTGREEQLQQLYARLTARSTATLTQPYAINGLGGIGKTQMALEYAYRYQQHYRSIFWVSAATSETLRSSFVRLAGVVGLPFQEPQDTQRTIAAIKAWLAVQQEWLLIFDNADDVELVSDYLPERATLHGHIILTTRSQATGSIAYAIEVTQMSKEEGALLLLRRAKMLSPEATYKQAMLKAREEAESIVKELDGLPLALDQAGAYIEETGCSLSAYLNLYRQRHRALLGRRGRLALDHPEPVAAIWDLSFRLIEQANPAAADLLRLCAFLDPDAIPEEILTQGRSHLGPTLEAVAADTFAVNQAIEELRKFSLIRRNADARTLSLHRLVQTVLKDEMNEEARRIWAERAVRVVNEMLPDVDGPLWFDGKSYISQAQAGAFLIEHYDMAFVEAAKLINKNARFLYTYALYRQAEILYRRALVLQKKTLGSEHPDTSTTLNYLALLYQAQGRYTAAEPFYLQALAIREKVLGLEHPDTATTIHWLAKLCFDQGKYAKAEELYLRALTIREKVLGLEHPDTASTLHWLAKYYLIQGKYAKAEELYLRSLTITEKALGPEHPSIALTFNGLGNVYRDQKKYTEAEALYLRSLAIRERVLGPTHLDTASTLTNLGNVYRDQGKYTEAEALYLRSLAIRERVLGPQDLHTADTLGNLAQLYRLQDRYKEAILLFEQVLTIRESVLEQGHLSTSGPLRNLAILYLHQDEYERAERQCKQALAIDEQTYGPEHSEVAADLEVYITLLQRLNRDEEAAILQIRVQAINVKSE